MQAIIADFLAQHFSTLDFVTRAGGLASVLVKSRKDKPDVRLPVVGRVFDAADLEIVCRAEEDYYEVIPDSRYAALVYFEDYTGAKVVASTRRGLTWEGRLRMVVWLNFKEIDPTLTVGDVQQALLAHMPSEIPSQASFYGATVKPSRIFPARPSPFANYSYDEAQSQFLTAPYGSLVVEVTYRARAARGCALAVNLTPTIC